MLETPFISIIIDNFNYARFIRDAIDSALTQTYPHYEIIVVDDASTDDSRNVILSYGNKISPIFLAKNGGQGAAFNAGFAASRGEIICFLDADDLFFPNKLAVIAATAMEHPDATLIYHRGVSKDKYLDQINNYFPEHMPEGHTRHSVLQTCETNVPPTSFLVFRREFLQKILPLAPFLTRIDADFPLQIISCLQGKIVAIHEPLGIYRVHGDNWFHNHDRQNFNLELLKKSMRRTEKALYYVNSKLAAMGETARLNPLHHRYHMRNMFIFKQINWRTFLYYSFRNPTLRNLTDLYAYIKFGLERRKAFNNCQ